MRFKTAAALMVLVLIFTGTMNAFAVQFTDIDEAPWAVTHIERMAEKGVISGSIHPTTGQRIYLPNNPVTKVEAIVMLYSLLQKTNQLSSGTDYTSKYQGMLTSAKIPDWARKQVGYALETGILTTGNLSTFMRAGDPEPVQNPATREEVAIYFGRALDQDNQVNGEAVGLQFVDTESITGTALPYVGFLVEKRIISGDTENRFNPRATITRAEMAALSNKTFDVLEEDEEVVIDLTPVNNGSQTPDTRQSTVREGEIQLVNQDTGVIVVQYEDDDQRDILQVTNRTIIRINSITHELINLRQGQEAEFTFDEDHELIRVEINPLRNYYYGKVVQVFDLQDYYAIVFESTEKPGERKSFQVDDQTVILINGSVRSLSNLQTGTEVRIEYEGQKALTIETGSFRAADQEVDGILESTVNFQVIPYTLQVKTTGNLVREFEIDDSVVVRIDDSRGYLEELTRGDVVTLYLDGDKDNRVTRIEALGLENVSKIDGTIDSMIISRNVQITFTDKDNTETSYTVAEGARVYADNQRIDIRDLQLPAEATIFVEGTLVTEIEASKAYGSQVLQGRIVRIRDTINMMMVRHLTAGGAYQETPVYVTDSTLILGLDGQEIRLRNLSTDQEIFVTGVYDGSEFVADRILVLQD